MDVQVETAGSSSVKMETAGSGSATEDASTSASAEEAALFDRLETIASMTDWAGRSVIRLRTAGRNCDTSKPHGLTLVPALLAPTYQDIFDKLQGALAHLHTGPQGVSGLFEDESIIPDIWPPLTVVLTDKQMQQLLRYTPSIMNVLVGAALVFPRLNAEAMMSFTASSVEDIGRVVEVLKDDPDKLGMDTTALKFKCQRRAAFVCHVIESDRDGSERFKDLLIPALDGDKAVATALIGVISDALITELDLFVGSSDNLIDVDAESESKEARLDWVMEGTTLARHMAHAEYLTLEANDFGREVLEYLESKSTLTTMLEIVVCETT